MKTLRDIQVEQKKWSEHNFGSHPAWQPLLGIAEECGELCHAVLKQTQGIRGTSAEHTEAMKDACADIMIYLCDFASCKGIDLQSTLNKVWSEVSKRDWKKFPEDGLTR